MSIDFTDFINALEDDEFDERPVDIEEFVTSQEYLGLPPLSKHQYVIIKMGTQIYKESSLIKLYGEEEGRKRHKLTMKELVLALGKACNVGSDEVYNAENGQWVKISDMQNVYSGHTAGLNGNEFCTESFTKGIANVHRVRTAKGFNVTVSEDHTFMTKDGARKLKDLHAGDRIAISSKLDIINPVKIDDDELKILAYWLGDGMMPLDQPSKRAINTDFSLNDREALKEYIDIFIKNGDSPTVKKHKAKKMVFVRHPAKVNQYAFSIINKYDLWNLRAVDKRVPLDIFSTTDEQVGVFLGRLWGTDGCVYKKHNGSRGDCPVAEYATISKGLAQDIQRLLVRLGIVSSLREKHPKYTYNGETRVGQTAYIITVSDIEGFRRFVKNVKMLDKQATANVLLDEFAARKSQSHYDGTLFYDKIISIEGVGAEEVFTLTASDTHFYNAGMIMNGNSGK